MNAADVGFPVGTKTVSGASGTGRMTFTPDPSQ